MTISTPQELAEELTRRLHRNLLGAVRVSWHPYEDTHEGWKAPGGGALHLELNGYIVRREFDARDLYGLSRLSDSERAESLWSAGMQALVNLLYGILNVDRPTQ